MSSGTAPRRSTVEERLDPYRALFIIGFGLALAGTLVWLLGAMHLIAYPGLIHRTLMIEGFEQSFISGFLLTALGGLTHGGRSTSLEMALATVAQLGVGVATFMGQPALAHGFFVASMLVLFVSAASRALRGRSQGHPPRELIFIVTALVMGLIGGLVLFIGAIRTDGVLLALGIRLVAQGEVLTLVVGVGSILVPTFLGHRIQGQVAVVSRPGWRGQAGFYAVIVVALVGAFGLEGRDMPGAAAAARAVAVSAVLLGVWKIHRPGSATRLAFCLRAAGFAVLIGLWIETVMPAHRLLGEHIVFIGGYGLLTMAIATRVVVAHGAWPPGDEARLLHVVPLVALALSLALRLASEVVPEHASGLWGAAGALWSVAWLLWAGRAIPRVLSLNRAGSIGVSF